MAKKDKLNKLIRQYTQEALSNFNKRTSNEQCCCQIIKLNGDGTGTLPDGTKVPVREAGISNQYSLACKLHGNKWATDNEQEIFTCVGSSLETIMTCAGSASNAAGSHFAAVMSLRRKLINLVPRQDVFSTSLILNIVPDPYSPESIFRIDGEPYGFRWGTRCHLSPNGRNLIYYIQTVPYRDIVSGGKPTFEEYFGLDRPHEIMYIVLNGFYFSEDEDDIQVLGDYNAYNLKYSSIESGSFLLDTEFINKYANKHTEVGYETANTQVSFLKSQLELGITNDGEIFVAGLLEVYATGSLTTYITTSGGSLCGLEPPGDSASGPRCVSLPTVTNTTTRAYTNVVSLTLFIKDIRSGSLIHNNELIRSDRIVTSSFNFPGSTRLCFGGANYPGGPIECPTSTQSGVTTSSVFTTYIDQFDSDETIYQSTLYNNEAGRVVISLSSWDLLGDSDYLAYIEIDFSTGETTNIESIKVPATSGETPPRNYIDIGKGTVIKNIQNISEIGSKVVIVSGQTYNVIANTVYWDNRASELVIMSNYSDTPNGFSFSLIRGSIPKEIPVGVVDGSSIKLDSVYNAGDYELLLKDLKLGPNNDDLTIESPDSRLPTYLPIGSSGAGYIIIGVAQYDYGLEVLSPANVLRQYPTIVTRL